MRAAQIAIILTGFLLGFLLTHQIAAQDKLASAAVGGGLSQTAVETSELIKNIDKLEQEKQKLDEQKIKLGASNQDSESALQEDIERLQIISGKTQVEGQGINISFDKPISASDLIDLANVLRNIGAEAIAVGGKRIVATTGFSQDDIKAPLTVSAIGKKELLKEAVSRRGGILEQIGQGAVVEYGNLTLPAVK